MHGRSHRSGLLALVAALVMGAAGRLGATESVQPLVVLAAPTCSAADLDLDALVVALRTALPSSLGPSATLTRERPYAVAHHAIATSDVAAAERPATVALALSRELESLRPPAPPPPSPPSAEPAPAQPAATLPPDRKAHRLRVLRNLAIGGAVATVAGAVIGGPLVSVGTSSRPDQRPALIASGAVLLAISGAALITTAVTLGLWLRERRR